MNFNFISMPVSAPVPSSDGRCVMRRPAALSRAGDDLTQIAPITRGASAAGPAPQRAAPTRPAVRARPARALILAPVSLFCCLTIAFGWSTRDEFYVVPEEGLGYALGITGLAMMALLLLYSLRKRLSFLRRAGAIQRWFHIHMALGLLGPTAILYHANFHLGSLNANVALVCMLTVSLSGVVGRFIYTRIHYEYRGHVASLAELRQEALVEGGVLGEVVRTAPGVGDALEEFRRWAFGERGLLARAVSVLTLGRRARRTQRHAMRAYRRAARNGGARLPARREVRRAVRQQVRAIRRVTEYAVYERAFALWHALHLPFCVGLFAAAAVHVVAVHMY